MTFLAPFDGSDLSKAALVRALEYAEALGESVVAVTVIPENDWGYAREQGWVEEGEPFETGPVAEEVEQAVRNLSEDIQFRYETVDSATPRVIASEIGRVADEIQPAVVFLGSENAGQVVTPISSVGGEVAADAEYDVHVVRHWSPTLAQEVRTAPEITGNGGDGSV